MVKIFFKFEENFKLTDPNSTNYKHQKHEDDNVEGKQGNILLFSH